MNQRYLLALDQGTTSSRAVLFTKEGQIVSSAAFEFPQHYPQPGWVEHDPQDILTTQIEAMRAAVRTRGRSPPSASPTSARPRSCGTGRRASPPITPSSGSAAAPRTWWRP